MLRSRGREMQWEKRESVGRDIQLISGKREAIGSNNNKKELASKKREQQHLYRQSNTVGWDS